MTENYWSPLEWISDEEWIEIEKLEFGHRTPYVIAEATKGMLSLLRFGGKLNDASYVYWPQHDAAVRSDVNKLLIKMRKADSAKHRKQAKQAQGELL